MENKPKRSALSWIVGILAVLSCLCLFLSPGGRNSDGFRWGVIGINLANLLNGFRARRERA